MYTIYSNNHYLYLSRNSVFKSLRVIVLSYNVRVKSMCLLMCHRFVERSVHVYYCSLIDSFSIDKSSALV